MTSSKATTLGCLIILTMTASQQGWSAERLFPPIKQPLGGIAPIVLSDADLRGNASKGYRPWFENGSWQGDLVEYTVTNTGGLSTSVDLTKNPPTNTGPNWSARLKFAANEKANSQYWDTIRKIITWNGSAQVPFRFTNDGIGAANKVLLDPAAPLDGPSDILNFVRGDRSKEFSPLAQANPLRRRNSILGDIIHSKPVYVGAPNDIRTEASYAEFAQLNSDRAPRVYVGANDGMLHVFDAADGNEVYAYVPSMLMGKLSLLAARSYPHAYYVDGELSVRDVQIKDKWHTVLAGSLGAGGKGFFILDITDPDLTSESDNSGANNKVLFEYSGLGEDLDGKEDDDLDLGDSFSRPVIAKLNDGDWYVITGNGYNSENGAAMLYLVNLDDLDKKPITISTGPGNKVSPNGLSSPSLLDTNRDGTADYAYAGDIDGNLWKFDLTGPSGWKVAYNGSPLHPAAPGQSIVQAPQIALHPQRGYMLYFATGRLFTTADLSDTSVQSLYGIWDSGNPPPDNAADQELLKQKWDGPKTYNYSDQDNAATQTIAIYNPDRGNPDWARQHGWKVDFPADGYRVLQPVQVRANRVKATVHKPIRNQHGENWLVEAVLSDGGPNPLPIFDLNVDAVLNLDDRYQDKRNKWHVPMMWQRDFGVMSQVTIAYLSGGIDALFVNNLQPRHDEPCKKINLNDNCPSGFLGGHIDVQTYHRDVPLDGKPTADTHEYDTLTKRVWVDFFDLFSPVSSVELCNIFKQKSVLDQVEIDSDGNNDICPSYPKKSSDILIDDKFIVLVANADLSPGSTLRIGNKSWNVMEYQREIHKALKNWDPTVSGSFPMDESGNSLAFSWGAIQAEKHPVTNEPGSISHEFDDRAILDGVLHPTQPACVATNIGNQLTKGRWRNGALTTQLIKMSYFTGAPVNPAIDMVSIQEPTDLEPYVITQEGKRVDTHIEYADNRHETVGGLVAKTQDERIWESTLFWHFGDLAFTAKLGRPCYGDPGWEAARDFELSNDPISATLAALDENLTSDSLAAAVELDRENCAIRTSSCSDYDRWMRLNNLLELSKDYTRLKKQNVAGYLPPEITFIIPGGTSATITEGTLYEPGRMSWTDIVK